MDLTKNQKILIGIVHFLPIVGIISYFIFFFSFFLVTIANIENQNPEVNPAVFFKGFIGAFIIMMITVVISIGIKVFDIIHLIRSNKNDTGNKVLLWVLLFIFTGTIAEIIYFFIEILPAKKQQVTEHKA